MTFQALKTTAGIPSETLHPEAPVDMAQRAAEAAAFLKTLAHEGRLMILCHLGAGEKSVGELEALYSRLICRGAGLGRHDLPPAPN